MKSLPVSFKGTYCIALDALQEKSCNKLFSKAEKYEMILESGSCKNQHDLFIHTPYKYDSDMIKMLSKLQIPYKSMDSERCLDSDNIIKRMVMPDYEQMTGCIMESVNTKYLDKLLQKDTYSYVGINARGGSVFKYDRFKRYLRTNEPISTPVIYLKKNNNGEINVYVQNGRHRFAVLRDLGLDSIPVTIDKDSIELAREINLIK